MDVTIKKLTEVLTEDFLGFFDDVAFSDNKDWSGCYCWYYHTDDDTAWMKRTAQDNRASAAAGIRAGTMRGYLAYRDGKPVGWCNANDKRAYTRLMADDALREDGSDKACAIVCYIVAPACRGMGIATKLLARVCSDAAKEGYAYVEAYPRKGNLTIAQHYHGTLSMYRKAGFDVHRSLERMDIVRKML